MVTKPRYLVGPASNLFAFNNRSYLERQRYINQQSARVCFQPKLLVILHSLLQDPPIASWSMRVTALFSLT